MSNPEYRAGNISPFASAFLKACLKGLVCCWNENATDRQCRAAELIRRNDELSRLHIKRLEEYDKRIEELESKLASAEDNHIAQQRNTIAFMEERDELQGENERLREALDYSETALKMVAGHLSPYQSSIDKAARDALKKLHAALEGKSDE